MNCTQCKSSRIIHGYLRSAGEARSVFSPKNMKFAAMTLVYGPKLQSYACIDCGNVWLGVDPKELKDFVDRHCNEKSNG